MMAETIAFRMFLNPGQQAEYRRRHDAIWPELRTLLSDAGISDYRIYLDQEHNVLFATLRRRANHGMDGLPQHPVMQSGGLIWATSCAAMQTARRSWSPCPACSRWISAP